MGEEWEGLLRAKQVRVRASSCQLHFIVFNAVEQKPVWFDVQVAKADPVATKSMIFILDGQRLFLRQQSQNRAKLRHVFAALLCSFYVLAETGGWNQRQQKSDAQISEQSIWGFEAFALACIQLPHRF